MLSMTLQQQLCSGQSAEVPAKQGLSAGPESSKHWAGCKQAQQQIFHVILGQVGSLCCTLDDDCFELTLDKHKQKGFRGASELDMFLTPRGRGGTSARAEAPKKPASVYIVHHNFVISQLCVC